MLYMKQKYFIDIVQRRDKLLCCERITYFVSKEITCVSILLCFDINSKHEFISYYIV